MNGVCTRSCNQALGGWETMGSSPLHGVCPSSPITGSVPRTLGLYSQSTTVASWPLGSPGPGLVAGKG